MNQYWKANVKVAWEDDKGKVKYRREEYIVNAINPTDVESKVTKHLEGTDFELANISITKIIDIIN